MGTGWGEKIPEDLLSSGKGFQGAEPRPQALREVSLEVMLSLVAPAVFV